MKADFKYFEKINSKNKAYWLGYICADGHLGSKTNRLILSSKDKEVIEKFKKDIKSEHKICEWNVLDKRTNKIYNSYHIAINDKILYNGLVKLGVSNNKTDVLNMPNIEEKYYSYFFAGLFDGDGCVQSFVQKNKIKFNNNSKQKKLLKPDFCRINLISTKEILVFLQEFLMQKFNIQPLKMHLVTKNKTNVWKLVLYKDAFKFLQFIYNDRNFSYLKRKHKKYQEIKKAGKNVNFE